VASITGEHRESRAYETFIGVRGWKSLCAIQLAGSREQIVTKIDVIEDLLEQLKIPVSELDCISDTNELNDTHYSHFAISIH